MAGFQSLFLWQLQEFGNQSRVVGDNTPTTSAMRGNCMELNAFPTAMNIELTTCCPLRCPQCYCTLEGGKHIPLNIAEKRVKEAGEMGVKTVHLSGGETLCYPYLYDIIKIVRDNCGIANIAISGWNFNSVVLSKLINAGVNGIFVSLNGSTEEVNSFTRDGFDYAINALILLKESRFENTYINWVMHSSNADDFPDVVALAEKYGVKHLVVLAVKPDSNHQLNSVPSWQQTVNVAEFIKGYHGKIQIMIESCYSQMLALVKDTTLFGNINIGRYKGCGAGRWSFNVSIDGDLSPCRHIELIEKYDTLKEYWNKSRILEKLRTVELDTREPCSNCYYSPYCRHCLAINSNLHNELYIGLEYCELWKLQKC